MAAAAENRQFIIYKKLNARKEAQGSPPAALRFYIYKRISMTMEREGERKPGARMQETARRADLGLFSDYGKDDLRQQFVGSAVRSVVIELIRRPGRRKAVFFDPLSHVAVSGRHVGIGTAVHAEYREPRGDAA